MSPVTIIIIGWLLSGVVSTGYLLAYWQNDLDAHPEFLRARYTFDVMLAWTFGLLGGPISLLVSLSLTFSTKNRGWRLF